MTEVLLAVVTPEEILEAVVINQELTVVDMCTRLKRRFTELN